MSANTETSKKTPAAKIRIGSQTASIWKNEKDGRVFYNVSFEAPRYQASNGEWKNSKGYSDAETLVLAKLADLAHTKVLELQEAGKQ